MFLFFVLSPPLVFLFANYSLILEKESKMFLWISICLAYFFAVLPPTMDSYRLFIVFQDAELSTLFQSYMTSHTDKDFFVPLLSTLFKSIGLNFFCLRFVFLLTCFLLLYAIHRDILKGNPFLSDNKANVAIAALCIILSVRCLPIAFGLRYATGQIFFLAGIYLLCKKKFVYGILSIGISVCLHFSLYVFLLPFLFALVFSKIEIKRIFKIILPIIALSFSYIISKVTSLPFLSDFVIFMDVYLNGDWMYREVSTGTVIFNFFKFLPFLILYVVYVYFEDEKSVWNRYVFFVSVMVFFFYNYWAIRIRFAETAALFLLVNYLLAIRSDLVWKRFLPCLLVALLCVQICYIYAFRREVFYYKNYVYWASPVCLLTDPIYDENWVMKNLDYQGEWVGNEVDK